LYRGDSPGLLVTRGPDDGQSVLIDICRLKPCRYQRRTVTVDRVRQLAETIKQNGLLQNVTARPISGDPDFDYELIAGHRRTAAFRLLLEEAQTPEDREKWARIPCNLKLGLSEVQVAALAAVENLERDDGDPLEQALSLLEVKKAGRFTTNPEVATATGMGLQRVSKLLRLAEAPDVMQRAVSPGVLIEVTDKDGTTRNQHVRVELTVVLAVSPYYRRQESNTDRAEAVAKTERLLQRIARFKWTRQKVEAEVKRLLRGRTASEDETTLEAEPDELAAAPTQPAPERRQLFRDKGVQFVIYTRNFDTASAQEREALLAWLKDFTSRIEGAGGTDEART
jgi:ParB/RepB/Spo0J family partition protein